MLKPFFAVRGQVLLPFIEITLDVGRESSKIALELSTKNYKNEIVVVTQENPKQELIESEKDLKEFGLLCKIISQSPSKGNIKVTLLPFKRVKVNKITISETNLSHKVMADYSPFELVAPDPAKGKILYNKMVDIIFKSSMPLDSESKRNISSISIKYNRITKELDNLKIESDQEFLERFYSEDLTNDLISPKALLNKIVNELSWPLELKYEYFVQIDWINQAEFIIEYLKSKREDQDLENAIDEKMKKNLSKQQKEFILREKMKAIRSELGESNEEEEEYKTKINDKNNKKIYPKSVRKLIANEESKLKNMMSSSPDANITRNYIDTLMKLPWRKTSIDFLDIKVAKKILDENHYGLKEVKERIIEFLAVLINNKNKNPDLKKSLIKLDKDHEINLNVFKESDKKFDKQITHNVPILALVGPPGTGKTSLAMAIAESINKEFVKISLGGVKDEAEIRGHRRTYVGAMPGKIIQGIKKAGVSNPLILLDEIDKMASDYKGDPASAMLEVLDPEQNKHFQDHYLEHEYDLSKVMFLATANYYEDIPAPLLDRVEIINLSSYTSLEKKAIAKNHLIKAVLRDSSLDEKYFQISDEVLDFIIKHYTLEAGVRGLKRVLDKMARKIVVKLLEGKIKEDEEVKIDEKKVVELLGVIKYDDESNDKEDQIGSVNGLAYTSYGGSTLQIEVNIYPGKHSIELTGSLKDVMKESAITALSFVRSNAEKIGIKDFDWENNSIHIHVPDGATPKDGPSAGVTFTTAIISALTKKKVSPLVGMTGEITLRGKVLPIGGLKEKSIAANKFGIKTVFIPYENKKNLVDVPDEVKEKIDYISVKEYWEIYNHLFLKK
ncbi:endopeptidase La [Mycoplasmopsis pulmonis]|uniref:endopeptidase La n=1 Tax=Mycoplasmopsis pulmonis TaxID=2107 RepID=UPI0010052293|nr:endopeptidase La [Mycoplasmopsis pulmonis]MDZ7293471.1 endopeptidase La [Mycoplasmopsis pulmonis]VEU68287.1 ATP-dependent protease La [Mycoplasmopsis pulmonis]